MLMCSSAYNAIDLENRTDRDVVVRGADGAVLVANRGAEVEAKLAGFEGGLQRKQISRSVLVDLKAVVASSASQYL